MKITTKLEPYEVTEIIRWIAEHDHQTVRADGSIPTGSGRGADNDSWFFAVQQPCPNQIIKVKDFTSDSPGWFGDFYILIWGGGPEYTQILATDSKETCAVCGEKKFFHDRNFGGQHRYDPEMKPLHRRLYRVRFEQLSLDDE